ncbi:MAG: GFA family protein [Kordiimonadaceae bacterium]|nr:GFA family protein [Kordiimonadaceae bacterium]
MKKVTHTGGCHCGTVRFEVDAPAVLALTRCTCSMCSKAGFIHLIVKAEDFRITAGKEALTEYRFNTETAKHLFCKLCGVKPFYVPRSHPDGWSVNATCIDLETVKGREVSTFDGANWEANIDSIR